MDIELKMLGKTLAVTVKGELDMLIAEKLRQEVDSKLESHDIVNLIFDMSKVTFIDSSGLGVIIGRYKKMKEGRGSMYIVGAKPAVEKILVFSGINKLIPMNTCEYDISNIK